MKSAVKRVGQGGSGDGLARLRTALSSRRRLPSTLAIVVGGGVFLLLGWLITTTTVATYLADVAPERALRLNPSHPVALLNVAEKMLLDLNAGRREAAGDAGQAGGGQPQARSADGAADGEQEDRARRAEIRAMVMRALGRNPLNARALRMLGQLAEMDGDAATTAKLMYAAVRLSVRESEAVHWVVKDRMRQRDFAAAIDYADALLRTNSRYANLATAAIAEMAAHPDGLRPVVARLASDPPWRRPLIANLNNMIRDARTPLNLFLALNETPNPPTGEELSGYLEFLVKRNFHELAYYTWLQFLPARDLARAGLLFNGSFDRRPSGVPFDWVLPSTSGASSTSGSGFVVEIATRRDAEGHRGLDIELLGGRVDFRGPYQILLMPPGSYKVAGEVNADLRGQRGFRWRINCISPPPPPGPRTVTGSTIGYSPTSLAAQPPRSAVAAKAQAVINPRIGESPMVVGTTEGWVKFEFDVTVPQSDCRAQTISLDFDARSASERTISGRIRFDNMSIVRVEEPEAAAAQAPRDGNPAAARQ
jgi:hypothetical protein